MRYLGPLDRLQERRQLPLAQMTDPYSSSYAAVEQWNPGRYYSETNQTPRSLPTGTTGQSTGSAPAPLSMYMPFVLLVVVIYALEKWKGRLFPKVKL